MAIQSSPMASVTRSTRRTDTEGLVQQQLHPHPLHHPVQAFAAANTNTVTRAAATPQNISSYQHTLSGRTKRQLDQTDHIVDFEHQKPKRPRTSIEILIRPALLPNKPAVANATPTANVTPTPHPTTTAATKPQAAAPLAKPTPKPAPQHVATVHPPNPAAAAANNNAAQLTKHQEKVINGIKHELDRLQPREADTHTKEGGRKLRSQEATRFRSELSAYFPEYDEVIGNEPKEQQLFTLDTPIVIFDSNPTRHHPVPWHRSLGATPDPSVVLDGSANSHARHKVPVRGYGDALFDELVDAQRIDFDFLGISHKREPVEDPLPDVSFISSHKRAERLEKSIRNTERGRAQHEKDQIARLLDGLQGHDWLRVMGVSGITETRKKQFEPARQHFVKGCQAILDKFRQWSLEEKRRKAEKDRALAEKAEAEESSSGDENSSAESESSEDDVEGDDETGDISDGDPPGSDDDDDSVTKQLREEATSRGSKNSKKRPRATPQPRPPPKPEPPREFKSFFKKRYERESALHRHRRAGRKVVAWGHPLPEIPEIDFDLPEELRDEETLRVHARKRRRDRRGRT
ncbi:something about silencing, SAS, complex subunit 4-domain-containing protein [Colletotrichum phormii]|uniref:Something about silencing, SAS, complex subunit 4-domain-containing protein n=1 Tax=Colletotrichum phormii TaxID=359342 RepID=A0AAJ0EEQ3_9PEZI|nr:something about silencing, SAS, complex subunit 4-domain-containing protein [Colletotrichum phormii]KAK1636098.1 something about silencing, SAS, complex subunit 4-domain-containing protein [Colletotrichum phormii]